jgi:hypothetical protein
MSSILIGGSMTHVVIVQWYNTRLVSERSEFYSQQCIFADATVTFHHPKSRMGRPYSIMEVLAFWKR